MKFWRERERENKEQILAPLCGQVRVLVVGDSVWSYFRYLERSLDHRKPSTRSQDDPPVLLLSLDLFTLPLDHCLQEKLTRSVHTSTRSRGCHSITSGSLTRPVLLDQAYSIFSGDSGFEVFIKVVCNRVSFPMPVISSQTEVRCESYDCFTERIYILLGLHCFLLDLSARVSLHSTCCTAHSITYSACKPE